MSYYPLTIASNYNLYSPSFVRTPYLGYPSVYPYRRRSVDSPTLGKVTIDEIGPTKVYRVNSPNLKATAVDYSDSPVVYSRPLVVSDNDDDSPMVFTPTASVLATTESAVLSPAVSSVVAPLGTSVIDGPLRVVKPLYPRTPIVEYQNLDNDPTVRRRMMKYYYNKIHGKWIMDDYDKLHKYVKVQNGKAGLIKNLSSYQKGEVAAKNTKLKIKFLLDNYAKKEDIKRYLHQYIKDSQGHWYNLGTEKLRVKRALYKYMKEAIRDDIG